MHNSVCDEQGFIQNVNLIFCVKFDEKNYAKKNQEETYYVFGLGDKVTDIPSAGNFKDWDSEFDIIYSHSKAGTTSKNHFFSFEYENINNMLLTTTSTQNLI